MGYLVKQGSLAQPLLFLMVLSSDHVTGATGKTPTVVLSQGGAAFATPAGSVTEVGSGWYQVAANATDNGHLGPLLLHATATACDPTDDQFEIVSYNPTAPPIVGATDSGALSANDVIADALAELNAIGAGDPIPGPLGAFCLRRLNQMISNWATHRLTMLATARDTYALVSGTQDYTVGEDGTFNVLRPTAIERAAIIPVGLTVEIPVDLLTEAEWNRLTLKSLTSPFPTLLTYTTTFPLGTLRVFPVPTTAPTLVLYTPTAITGFANLATSYSFAPGYAQALYSNLAKNLATPLGRNLPDATAELARTSLGDIKRQNQILTELQLPMGGRLYSIYSDGPA